MSEILDRVEDNIFNKAGKISDRIIVSTGEDRNSKIDESANESENRNFEEKGENNNSKIDKFTDELHSFFTENRESGEFGRLAEKFNEMVTDKENSKRIPGTFDNIEIFIDDLFESVDKFLGISKM